MQNLTLQQLFGTNASQNATTITIKKSDFAGLTPGANNSAESLLAAILLLAANEFGGRLVDEADFAIVDETGETILYDQRGLYEKLNVGFWRRRYFEEKVMDTFIMNAFISPPPPYGTALSADWLSYV